MDKKESYLSIDKQLLRTWVYGEIDPEKTCIVLLHGGLDSLDTWKGFPEELALQTQLTVIAYERFGHGKSGRLTKHRESGYRHHEAEIVLPEVINAFGLKRVILVGHSDGAAISLMAAASLPETVVAVCAIAPPLVPEKTVRDGIVEAIREYENGGLANKLKKFHGEATDALFYGWAKAWLSEQFDDWSCAKELQRISCPVALVFGQADDYGYQPSLDKLLRHLKRKPEVLLLQGVGHMPHHHARKETIQAALGLNKLA